MPAKKNTAPTGKQEFYVVGIGASAGGLDAYKRFLKAIPEDSGMAYVLVQHLNPSHQSSLPELLSKVTKIPVHEITDDIKLTPNNIFIIPENKMLTVQDGVLKLDPRSAGSKINMSIDHFLKSLAEVHTCYAIGVILSGTANDGTKGLKSIKENGGITFAQDLQSAAYDGMPQSAINAEVVDFILPPENIPKKLMEIVANIKTKTDDDGDEHMNLEDEKILKQIITIIRHRTGVDFSYYKQPTIQRRLARRMSLKSVRKLSEYLELLKQDKEEQDALFYDVLIPVTAFFRDPKTFNTLTNTVFPELLKKGLSDTSIRVWVAGCSTGEEAYSLAISLHEFFEDKLSDFNIQIFATDISEVAITKARTAVYTAQDLEGVSPLQLQRYFTKLDGSYHVSKFIRSMCIFAVHNFLKDPPFSKIDLVSCRNVLIYMDSYLQKKALTSFHYALKENGYLLLGKSESISNARELFIDLDIHDKIYLRKSVRGRFMPVTSAPKEEEVVIDKSYTINKQAVSATDFQKTIDEILLSKYTPSAVIINEQNDIIHFRGDTGFYLSPSPGKASLNILKMVKQGLSFELRNALHKAQKKKVIVKKENIPVEQDGSEYMISVEIIPLPNTIESHFLILFQKIMTPVIGEKEESPENLHLDAARLRIEHLENELAQMREDIRSISEDQEAANEELQSANEELLSSSEELQTINEELETSKEELQSGNEELQVINQELIERQEILNATGIQMENLNKQLTIQNEIFRQAEGSCNQGSYSYNLNTGVLAYSDNLYKLIGYEKGEIQNTLEEYNLHVHPDDRATLKDSIDKIISDKQSADWKYRMITKSGAKIYIKGTGRIISTGSEQILVGTLQDITADTMLNKHLQLREAQLSESQRLGKTGSWEIDFKTDKLKWSDEVYRMYGYQPGEIEIDNETYGRVHPDDIAAFREGLLHSKTTGEPFEMEYRRYDKVDRLHYISSKGNVRLDKQNKPGSMLCISIDLTELREKEAYLREANQELENKNIELERTNLELSSFSYAASHDLQEPLRKILTFSTRLKDKYGDIPAGMAGYLTKIEESSLRMSVLITNLLDYSRLGNPDKLFETIDLNDIVKNVSADFELLIEQKQAEIQTGKLPVIEAIALQMNQLFYNLIGNALKFTKPDQKPVLRISSHTLTAEQVKEHTVLDSNLSFIEIIFLDNGIGFDPLYSKQIFTIFKRLHEQGKYEGTGIGLSLTKKIVEIHHGFIFATSKENEGSEFHVILPVRQP